MNRIIIVFTCIVLPLLVSSCLEDSDLKVPLNFEPEQLNDGLVISSPGEEGFDENAIQEAYNLFFSDDEFITGISLLVMRNDKLVAEGYCRDLDDRNVRRNIQSTTKSFTSLVFGIARDMGYFDSLDQQLYDIIPEAFDTDLKKRDITIRHLMTMKSGLEIDNEDFAQELHIKSPENQMQYLLAKPLFADPGTRYWYRDCDPQLLGGAIYKQSSQTLEEIADDKLFGPLGITDYFWERNADGHNWAAQALYMKPRDMAKIGLLMLNNGKWNGQQLVSEEWIEQSTSFQTVFDIPGEDRSSEILPDMGFYWWIYEPDFPRLPEVRAFSAVGSGGQYIFVVPDLELTIVMTAEPYVDGDFSLGMSFFSMAALVIDAIKK